QRGVTHSKSKSKACRDRCCGRPFSSFLIWVVLASAGPHAIVDPMIVFDGEVFLEEVGPLMRPGDLRRLARFVEANWSCEELRRLLDSNVDDARAAAAITLGLVAQVHYTPVLAEALHDPATAVADAAEQALWRLWFNGGAHAARPS